MACFSFGGVYQTASSLAADWENAIDMDRHLHFRGVYILCQYLIVVEDQTQPIGDFGLKAD